MANGIVYIQEQHPNPINTFVRAEVAELVRRSYDVSVVTLRRNEQLASECGYSNRIYQVSPTPGKEIELLRTRAEQFSPKYLHTHFVTEAIKYTFHVAQALDVPFGFTAHSHDIWTRGERVEPELVKTLANHELCICVATEGSNHRNYLKWCGVPDEKLINVPNSVSKDRLPAERGAAPSRVGNLVLVGRPLPKKGFFVAIDAVRLLRLNGYEVNLDIVGGVDPSKPLGQMLAVYIQNLPYVSSTELVPHDASLELIKEADALVVPSIFAENGDSDGIPTVLAEAMLMGVPVVTTDVGSVSDLVVDGVTGFVARAGDPASLADKVAELDKTLQNSIAAEELLKAARKRAMQQEVQASANTLVAHLEQRLGKF